MQRKIILYAIDDYGNGYVTKLGEFDSLEEIQIKPSMFKSDVVIEFEKYEEPGE